MEPKKNIICLGISHHTAAVDVREQFAVSPGRLSGVLDDFMRIEGVEEAVILSTCNRVEFYAAGTGLQCGYRAFHDFLCGHSGLEDDDFEMFYRYDFPRSAEHLFRVACGMDSMVTGETEILGQVKKAYSDACSAGSTSKVLNKLFQRSFQVSKQVRSKTGINRGAISVGSVAVDLASRIFGKLDDCKVMIVGAGENSERTARNLISRGVRQIMVANRSPEKAARIAEAMNGKAVPLEKWEEHIEETDILISSTAAPHPIIDGSKLEPLMGSRFDRPLFIIDIAVPRDVDPDANEIENVFLFDIDSLEAIAAQSLNERQAEARAGEKIIDGHVNEFGQWLITSHAPSRKSKADRTGVGSESLSPESTG